MSIIEIIDGYGTKSADKIAHIYKDSRMTYGELVEKSNALAEYLIYEYGEDKTPIVVYGHKQHEMLICFLACVKAGHAYIPVDSSFPMERVRDIIEGSGTRHVFNIEDKQLDLDKINTSGTQEIWQLIEQFAGKVPDSECRVKDEDTYYIIYTSGSTGRPKGVQITLSCLESFVAWGLKLCGETNGEDIFMNQAPFSFDLSVMDLYLSLCSGSALFSIDKAAIANMKQLFETLRQSGISIWVSTPSFAEMCLGDSSFGEELLPQLKSFLFCGEVLTNSCVERLHKRFSKAKVINTYGPTEATVAITSVEVTEEVNSIIPLPVGSVKRDCRILILDEEGRELPEGEKGEITIVGDSVSIGYYRNSEMTEKVFGKYFVNGIEKRGYRTGDEGYLKEGMLYYTGRIDFQVKLNGYRIELEDIENNLRKLEIIKNVVVIPVIKENKVLYLAAAVVLSKSLVKRDFEIALLIKNELKRFLPEYMIPRKISIKDSLPMTVNGKVNRKLLMEEMK